MSLATPPARPRRAHDLGLALRALQAWDARRILVAAVATIAVGVLIGVVTVLIPNDIFGRDIPPVWWNYPVWLLTSVLAGMLIATYVRDSRTPAEELSDPDGAGEAGERRTSRMGMAGGILAWFAVGCPVCNKIALLALGYSGAITWFAPVQPFLAVAGLLLTGVALVWRLRGQVSCPVPQVATR